MFLKLLFVFQEDEVDPLDAFMSGIQEEVRKINRVDIRGGVKKGTKVTGKRPAWCFVCCSVITHVVLCQSSCTMFHLVSSS